MPVNKSVTAALALIQNDQSKVLGVKIGDHDVEPGKYIPKAEAQSPPSISFAVPDPSKTYMIVALDIDAPFPLFGVLGPILHWIQPGYKVNSIENGTTKLKSTDPFVANYIGPAPPPPSSPHRYCFFLYEQPEGFKGEKYAPPNGQKLGNWHRMRYDLDGWEKEIGLGSILACNYFLSN